MTEVFNFFDDIVAQGQVFKLYQTIEVLNALQGSDCVY